MANEKPTFLNTGIYTIPEAARLTRVSKWRIRRWLRGYKFYSNDREHHSPALWHGQLDPIENTWALGFLDLVEIRCVDAFLRAGVSWTNLRKAHSIGVELFSNSHPFCTNRFATDGREIFAELPHKAGEIALLEIVKKQRVFRDIVAPYFKELEFEAGDALARWRPLTTRRLVVLDPTRSFGHPIVDHHGVPTEYVAKAAVRNSVREISKWYDMPEVEINDAIEFEQKLAA